MVRPVVYETGKKSTVRISPLSERFGFFDDIEYKIFVLPLTEERELDKNVPDFVLKVNDIGELEFEYTFEHEQEYYIRIVPSELNDRETRSKIQLSVYAVDHDLYVLRPLKGDSHIHSSRSDGKDVPAVVAANYRRQGFDYMCLTDHNRYFGSLEAEEDYSDVKTDLCIIHGEEVHTPGSNLHIVHVGGEKSVAELYVKHREEYEKEVAEIEKDLTPDRYSHRIAQAIWATGKIHEFGGVAIFPHPFWISNVYNINLAMAKQLFARKIFDAFEVMGAQEVEGNNLALNLYNDLRAKGLSIGLVGDSDSHGTLGYKWFEQNFTIAFATSNTPAGIKNAIKKHKTVAVERTKLIEDPEYRVYGEFRYVMYARFLLDYYFPITAEMFCGEGQAMLCYVRGDANAKKLLAAYHGNGERFYREFFGKEKRRERIFDSEEHAKTTEKYDKIWKDYGVTKRGSAIE